MSDSGKRSDSGALPVVDGQNPWLGLLPFKEEHSRFFFGRDEEIDEIVRRIEQNVLTVLFGRSGLGKTSLLGAGVMKRLQRKGHAPVLLRFSYGDRAAPLIEQTLHAFRKALPTLEWPPAAGVSSLWELFHRRPAFLPSDSPLPVIIFDQFEEIFTLGRQHTDGKKGVEAGGMAEQWVIQMADLIENRPPVELEKRFADDDGLADQFDFRAVPLRVVFTLREDYLSYLEEWKGLLPMLMRNRMSLHLLDGPQALKAVMGPASLDGKPLLTEDVATMIVRKVANQSADTPLEEIEAVPPMLSLLCEQLNRTRLEAGAEAISAETVENQSAEILQKFYDESFDSFPKKDREAIRKVIEEQPMVTEGGFRNSVVRDDAERQLRSAGVADPKAAFDYLIANRRLLTADDKDQLERLEITHDVLLPLVLRSREERRERTRIAESRRQAEIERSKLEQEAEAQRIEAERLEEKKRNEDRLLREIQKGESDRRLMEAQKELMDTQKREMELSRKSRMLMWRSLVGVSVAFLASVAFGVWTYQLRIIAQESHKKAVVSEVAAKEEERRLKELFAKVKAALDKGNFLEAGKLMSEEEQRHQALQEATGTGPPVDKAPQNRLVAPANLDSPPPGPQPRLPLPDR